MSGQSVEFVNACRLLIWPFTLKQVLTLQSRHNGCDDVPITKTKKTSKLRVTSLFAGNSLVTSEFPKQKASNTENVSIWWRHHESVEFVSACWLLMWPFTLKQTLRMEQQLICYLHLFPLWLLNTLRLRQIGHHFKGIFLDENLLIWWRFHWSLFPRVQLTIFHHWFR